MSGPEEYLPDATEGITADGSSPYPKPILEERLLFSIYRSTFVSNTATTVNMQTVINRTTTIPRTPPCGNKSEPSPQVAVIK